MNNKRLKSSFVFFATIFGLIVVLIDNKTEIKVKIIAIVISILILVVFEWRFFRKKGGENDQPSWFVGVLSQSSSTLKQIPLLLLVFPLLVVSLFFLVFFCFSLKIDQNFVSSKEYLEFDSVICLKDYSNPDNQPVVDVSAECALEYAVYRSSWLFKYELPSKQEADANPVVSTIENCNPVAEFVFDKPNKDKPVLSIRQGNSIKPVREDVTDRCTSFRLKSSCNLLCALID